MKAVTYNNLIYLFSAYTENNLSIKRFGNGSLKDLETEISLQRTFPLMWSNLVQVDYPSFSTKLYTFNVLFMDVLDINDKSNEQDVWSDSIQLAEDYLKFLNWNQQNVYEVLSQPTVTTFTERFGEYVAGANIKIQIQVDADLYNNCNTPLITFPFNNLNAQINQ